MSSRRVTLGAGAVTVLVAGVLAVLLAGPAGTAGVLPVAGGPPAAHRDAQPAAKAPSTTHRRVERPAWTRAGVATVWLRPAKARPVDRPALRRTPDIRRW